MTIDFGLLSSIGDVMFCDKYGQEFAQFTQKLTELGTAEKETNFPK